MKFLINRRKNRRKNLINILLLTLCLFCVNSSTAIVKAPTLEVGGVKIGPDEMVKIITNSVDAIIEASKKSRSEKENAISRLEAQQVELGKHRDTGHIGQTEFDQTNKVIAQKIERLRHDLASQEKVGENVQSVLMGGWNTLLEAYKEEQQRKTHIAVAAATKAVENEGKIEQTRLQLDASMQKMRYMSDPQNLKSYAFFLTAASVGVAGGYYGSKLAYRYMEQKIQMRPSLALETSYQGWWDRCILNIYTTLGLSVPQLIKAEDTLVFAPELEEQLLTIAKLTKVVQEKGLPHQSLLLYGPPGTGKTWFATFLARNADMDYVITSADRFAQFAEGQDVQELHKLLDWAKNSSRGMIIFIDEIDALGAHRNNLDQQWIRLQNAFLARTGKSIKDFKIVGATNRITALDPAFLSRFPHRIEVPLPGVNERVRLLNLYLKKYINECVVPIKQHDGKTVDVTLKSAQDITADLITSTATKIDGLSGRDIEQIVDEMRGRICALEQPVLTKQIFDDVVAQKMRQFRP